MEFLIYSMAAVSMGFVLFKPKWEGWAFGLLAGSFVLSAALYLVAVAGSVVPAVNL